MAQPPMITRALQVALRNAFEEAARYRHEYVTLEHVLNSLVDDRRTGHALTACGADLRSCASSSKSTWARRSRSCPKASMCRRSRR